MVRVRLVGFRKAGQKIEVLRRVGAAGLPKNVRVFGEGIMTDVKSSRPGAGVPRDTGNLASTGRVDGPDTRNTTRLTFGGAAAVYALRQHEELSYRHPLGEARYLVRGLERAVAGRKPEEALRANAQAAIAAAQRA